MKRTFKRLFTTFAIVSFSVLPTRSSDHTSNEAIKKVLSTCALLISGFTRKSDSKIPIIDVITNEIVAYCFEYDQRGFHRLLGLHRKTGTKYNTYGYDKDGYNKYGYNKYSIHKDTDTQYDPDGYDESGFDKNGIHKATKTKYNSQGYNEYGYNKYGNYLGERTIFYLSRQN